MSRPAPIVLTAALALGGAASAIAAGAILGMPGGELWHLGLLLVPAIGVAALATAASQRLLAGASMRRRLLAPAFAATLLSLLSLGVLAHSMLVSPHDAVVVAILVIYALLAGIGVALGVARAASHAGERLTAAAARLADGDLDARVGALHAGPELDALAAALDGMAVRVGASLERERMIEGQRRDLIAAVSHDLRTPLAGLRAMVEAVDDGVVNDPPSLRRYAPEMRRAVTSVSELVDDLFELVQLDAGVIEAETERVLLRDAVNSALAACDAGAAAKGLVVETSLTDAGRIACSPRVGRVIQNLIQNAIRHTPEDGRIRVAARRAPEGVELVVEDTGEGIEPQALERIFDPFWRGDPARTADGSGLGLALAKRIVEALGGRIEVESEPARGSRFAVILPSLVS